MSAKQYQGKLGGRTIEDDDTGDTASQRRWRLFRDFLLGALVFAVATAAIAGVMCWIGNR